MLWRLGVGTPSTTVVRRQIGLVAAFLDNPPYAQKAARILGLPGLYRSPSCWGGDAPQPSDMSFSPPEWSARCQAASFEIAVPLGSSALPFVEENAFGPLEMLQGVALRALVRMSAAGHGDAKLLTRVMERISHLEPSYQNEALDGFSRMSERLFGHLQEGVRKPIVDGLELILKKATNVRLWLRSLDPLIRFAPDRARRFLPDLRKLLARDEHALDAALLLRALEPRDTQAREVLRRWAYEHPDQNVRDALTIQLKPPHLVPGGLA